MPCDPVTKANEFARRYVEGPNAFRDMSDWKELLEMGCVAGAYEYETTAEIFKKGFITDFDLGKFETMGNSEEFTKRLKELVGTCDGGDLLRARVKWIAKNFDDYVPKNQVEMAEDLGYLLAGTRRAGKKEFELGKKVLNNAYNSDNAKVACAAGDALEAIASSLDNFDEQKAMLADRRENSGHRGVVAIAITDWTTMGYELLYKIVDDPSENEDVRAFAAAGIARICPPNYDAYNLLSYWSVNGQGWHFREHVKEALKNFGRNDLF